MTRQYITLFYITAIILIVSVTCFIIYEVHYKPQVSRIMNEPFDIVETYDENPVLNVDIGQHHEIEVIWWSLMAKTLLFDSPLIQLVVHYNHREDAILHIYRWVQDPPSDELQALLDTIPVRTIGDRSFLFGISCIVADVLIYLDFDAQLKDLLYNNYECRRIDDRAICCIIRRPFIDEFYRRLRSVYNTQDSLYGDARFNLLRNVQTDLYQKQPIHDIPGVIEPIENTLDNINELFDRQTFLISLWTGIAGLLTSSTWQCVYLHNEMFNASILSEHVALALGMAANPMLGDLNGRHYRIRYGPGQEDFIDLPAVYLNMAGPDDDFDVVHDNRLLTHRVSWIPNLYDIADLKRRPPTRWLNGYQYDTFYAEEMRLFVNDFLTNTEDIMDTELKNILLSSYICFPLTVSTAFGRELVFDAEEFNNRMLVAVSRTQTSKYLTDQYLPYMQHCLEQMHTCNPDLDLVHTDIDALHVYFEPFVQFLRFPLADGVFSFLYQKLRTLIPPIYQVDNNNKVSIRFAGKDYKVLEHVLRQRFPVIYNSVNNNHIIPYLNLPPEDVVGGDTILIPDIPYINVGTDVVPGAGVPVVELFRPIPSYERLIWFWTQRCKNDASIQESVVTLLQYNGQYVEIHELLPMFSLMNKFFHLYANTR